MIAGSDTRGRLFVRKEESGRAGWSGESFSQSSHSLYETPRLALFVEWFEERISQRITNHSKVVVATRVVGFVKTPTDFFCLLQVFPDEHMAFTKVL